MEKKPWELLDEIIKGKPQEVKIETVKQRIEKILYVYKDMKLDTYIIGEIVKDLLKELSVKQSSLTAPLSESTISLKYVVPANGDIILKEMEIESEGQREAIPLRAAEKDYVPFLLYRLRGITGVCLIKDEEGRRRYLPRIITEAMKISGRKIEQIACAMSLEELKRMGF